MRVSVAAGLLLCCGVHLGGSVAFGQDFGDTSALVRAIRQHGDGPSGTARVSVPMTREVSLSRPRPHVFRDDLVTGEFECSPSAGLHTYDDGFDTLYFVGAEHDVQSTLELVKEVFRQAPAAVIVEREPNFEKYCQGDSGESCLAVRLAKGNVIAGEFDPPDQLLNLLKNGVSTKDYEGFWLIRTLTDDKGRRAKEFGSFDVAFMTLSDEFRRVFSPTEALFTKEEFQDWCTKGAYVSADFDFDRQYRSFQQSAAWVRLLDTTTVLKDKNLGPKIANALNLHKKVLVVYGDAHYCDLRKALDAMMALR